MWLDPLGAARLDFPLFFPGGPCLDLAVFRRTLAFRVSIVFVIFGPKAHLLGGVQKSAKKHADSHRNLLIWNWPTTYTLPN